jgi:hypothetical protein
MGPNELLLLLSARKSGSWYQFRSCVDEVMGEENSGSAGFPLHQRIRWNLSRLAHIEFADDEENEGWRAVPPVLAIAKAPIGFLGVLCGARSLDLLGKFGSVFGALDVETVPLAASPDALRVTSPAIAALEVAAQSVGIPIQREAAASLLSVLDPIHRRPSGPPQEFPFGKDLIVERFAVVRQRYRWEKIESGKPVDDGLYKCTRWQQPEHFLRGGGRFTRVAGPVGKFIILNSMKRNVLRYDGRSWNLKLPAMCRPPPLIDRALHLCSGMLPAEAPGKHGLVLTYSNIAPGVASLAAELLGQKLA